MTAIADLLTRPERDKLLDRLRELGDLARLMRQPGTLASHDRPPLHRTGGTATTITERTQQ